MLQRLATDEEGSVYLYYGLALLLVAIISISQPSVAMGILYQLETWARIFVGQLLSLI